MFIAGSFTITKIWKQCVYSLVVKWIKKMWYTHTHTHTHTHMHTIECYSGIKKKSEILPFLTTQIDLEGIGLSE